LEEENNKWEVLFYESAEMGVSQLAKAKSQLLEAQERESKALAQILELQHALQEAETHGDFEEKMEMQLETARANDTTEANDVKDENQRLGRRVLELEEKLRAAETSSQERLVKTQKRLEELESEHQEAEHDIL
jgi:chromosome segregation ATPase